MLQLLCVGSFVYETLPLQITICGDRSSANRLDHLVELFPIILSFIALIFSCVGAFV